MGNKPPSVVAAAALPSTSASTAPSTSSVRGGAQRKPSPSAPVPEVPPAVPIVTHIDNNGYRRYLRDNGASLAITSILYAPIINVIISYLDYTTIVCMGGITHHTDDDVTVDIPMRSRPCEPTIVTAPLTSTHAVSNGGEHAHEHAHQWLSFPRLPRPGGEFSGGQDEAYVADDVIYYLSDTHRRVPSLHYCDLRYVKTMDTLSSSSSSSSIWKNLKSFLGAPPVTPHAQLIANITARAHTDDVICACVLHNRLYITTATQCQVYNHNRGMWTECAAPPQPPIVIATSINTASTIMMDASDAMMIDDAKMAAVPSLSLRGTTTNHHTSNKDKDMTIDSNGVRLPTSYIYALMAISYVATADGGMADDGDGEFPEDTPFARYDPVADRWRQLPRMPAIRADGARAFVIPYMGIIVVGGWNNCAAISKAEYDELMITTPIMRYSFKTESWCEMRQWVMPPPGGRWCTNFAAIYTNDVLMVCGGRAATNQSNTNHIPSPCGAFADCWTLDVHDDAATWKRHPSLPRPRYGHALIAIA